MNRINRAKLVWRLGGATLLAVLCNSVGLAGTNLPAPWRTTNHTVATTDFFVSLRGNDNWSGRLADPGEKDGPFATITRARDAVRSLLKAQKPPESIRVIVRGELITLTQRSSSVRRIRAGMARRWFMPRQR